MFRVSPAIAPYLRFARGTIADFALDLTLGLEGIHEAQAANEFFCYVYPAWRRADARLELYEPSNFTAPLPDSNPERYEDDRHRFAKAILRYYDPRCDVAPRHPYNRRWIEIGRTRWDVREPERHYFGATAREKFSAYGRLERIARGAHVNLGWVGIPGYEPFTNAMKSSEGTKASFSSEVPF